jgi:hypothetical protein
MSQVAEPHADATADGPAAGPPTDGSGLALRQLTKEFGTFTAVKSIDLACRAARSSPSSARRVAARRRPCG